MWLGSYQACTPGVEALVDTSTALSQKSEPQPDALLRILEQHGGRTQADRRFIHGVPELLVEVAHTSRYTDLGPKFDDYERLGVLEYIVRAMDPDEVKCLCCAWGAWSTCCLARMGSTARSTFPDYGSTRNLSWPATYGGCKPLSRWAAPHRAFVAKLKEAQSPI
jgi:hypothetical protein